MLTCLAVLVLALEPAPQAGEGAVAFPELALALQLPALEHLERKESKNPTEKASWTGMLGASAVRLNLDVLPVGEYGLFEPEDVVEAWRDSIREKSEYTFQPIRCIAGAVGCSPILATTRASFQSEGKKGSLFLVGGLLPEYGWSLRVDAWPELEAAAADKLALALETCAKYSGKARDPRWTDEEALALWKQHAPESTFKKYEKPVRTEHFIVMTNSTSPGPFVKKLEGWYASIKKAIPSEELKGRRLLPILLFRTDDDFQAFYRARYKLTVKDEVREESVCGDSWVATSCDNADDHEHLLDVSRLFIEVRLRAWGSNRWLESGLRECVASAPKERVEALRAIKKGKCTELEKLLDDSAWKAEDEKRDKKGTSDEADYWEQSALWMDFLRDGPWPKDSFQRFLRSVSGLAEHDHAGVVAALQSVYGMDPKALQPKWVEYYSKK
jgi:hypothetical protein